MMSVKEVAAAYRLGAPLEALIPEGADLTYWQRLVDSQLAKTAKPRRECKRASRPRQSQRRLSAAEALARMVSEATVEMVVRVNGGSDE